MSARNPKRAKAIFDKMRAARIECTHGSLARQCRVCELEAENERQAKAIVEYREALDVIAHEPGDVDAWHKQKARRGIEHGDNALRGQR